MSELLPVYRRSVCVSPAVVGVENWVNTVPATSTTLATTYVRTWVSDLSASFGRARHHRAGMRRT